MTEPDVYANLFSLLRKIDETASSIKVQMTLADSEYLAREQEAINSAMDAVMGIVHDVQVLVAIECTKECGTDEEIDKAKQLPTRYMRLMREINLLLRKEQFGNG